MFSVKSDHCSWIAQIRVRTSEGGHAELIVVNLAYSYCLGNIRVHSMSSFIIPWWDYKKNLKEN